MTSTRLPLVRQEPDNPSPSINHNLYLLKKPPEDGTTNAHILRQSQDEFEQYSVVTGIRLPVVNLMLDARLASDFLMPNKDREVAMRSFRFARIHCAKEALYVELFKQHPIIIDDEEVLVELSVFTASLTPLLPF